MIVSRGVCEKRTDKASELLYIYRNKSSYSAVLFCQTCGQDENADDFRFAIIARIDDPSSLPAYSSQGIQIKS